MMNKRQEAFYSSFIIPHSPFPLPVDSVEGDVDAAAFAVFVRDEEVADEAQREPARVVFERERVADGRGRVADFARVNVVAEAVPECGAFDAQLSGLRAAPYRQAV